MRMMPFYLSSEAETKLDTQGREIVITQKYSTQTNDANDFFCNTKEAAVFTYCPKQN